MLKHALRARRFSRLHPAIKQHGKQLLTQKQLNT